MRPSSLRRLTGGAAALVLVGATVLSTASLTLAAVPGATAVSEAIPASYSPGNLAGFRGTYLYTDGSTLAKLYLIVKTNGASGNAYVSATKNGVSLPSNACSTSTGDVVCTFKTVRMNDFFVVVTAYTPAVGATQVEATYNWSSTGSTTSDTGNTSHGDIWDGITHVSTLNSDDDYAGGFTVGSGGSFGNVQVVSPSNLQATRLGSLPANVAATVEDGAGLQPETPCVGGDPNTPLVVCSGFIGEWSNVTVGDGQSFESLFTVSIVFYSGTPKGFVHTYAGGQEFIGPCAKKSPTYPCFTWTAKTNTATIYTYHNGSFRGQ
jgi:hypothetical protein